MIEIKDIRPIPKYMLDIIKKIDLKENPTPSGHNRFYTYFTKYRNELCAVTVAVRNYYKKWYCKQIVVHGIHTDKVYLRDIEQCMGFIVIGWYREKITKYPKYCDYDWGWNEDKYFPMTTATIVNKNYILTLPEYKYSAIDKYKYTDILKYLRLYEKYPECELLVKCGLSELATSKMILNKCDKDKKFCKWLFKNRDKIIRHRYYVNSLVRAYNQDKTIEEIDKIDKMKKLFQQDYYRYIKAMLKHNEYDKFIRYLIKQNIDLSLYDDYLEACVYLELNMNEDKNKYPHDFMRWHDIRIDEMHSKEAEKNKRIQKELFDKFANVAEKYEVLQRQLKDAYITIIAKSPSDLIVEGDKLHHCVGRMGYDQKFAREESLIFFIRTKAEPNIPLVTIEYSLKTHKILQCYGDHDSKPSEEILTYVNKIWLPYANRKIKKIA